jgi:virulence factor Mce-like protein
MPNRGPRFNPAVVGLIGAAIMFSLLFYAFANVALFASTVDVKAQVATGDTLQVNADVEVAGVKVGTVKSIEKGDPGALIDMSVDTKKVAVYQDAGLQIRPHGVFGPKFVNLDPGNASAGGFADGGSIPLARTRVSVDFEQVLNSFSPDTRQSLQSFFVEFGTASDKRGGDFGQFLDNLTTVENQLSPVLEVIGNRASNTGRLFESNATMAETFGDSPFDQILKKNGDALAKLDNVDKPLTSVILHGNGVLASLDAITAGTNAQKLTTTVSKLPALFDNLQRFNNDLGYGTNAIAPAIIPQRGQVDSDVGLAVRRAQDMSGQCDITDQTNTALPPKPSNAVLADTVHTNFVKIVPCYSADGSPTRDAAGHVAHHHLDVLGGLHNHPIADSFSFQFGFSLPGYGFRPAFINAVTDDNEGSVLCGPNSGNSTRPNNPAFTCLHTAQSDPIPGHGGPPPPLFGVSAANGSATPTGSLIPGLPNTSRGLDLLAALVLVVGGVAIGFGFWRTRPA